MSAKTYSAERFDVTLQVMPDGSLQITENITFRFEDGPFTLVFRELPTHRTDDIGDIVASMDGRQLPTGEETGQASITRTPAGPLRVAWRFAATDHARRSFTLSYRVRGVVFQQTGNDVLEWRALPDNHDYLIETSTIRVSWPDGITTQSFDVVPLGHGGPDEVRRDSSGATVIASRLGRDASLEIRARFPQGGVIARSPEWKRREQATSTLGGSTAGVWSALVQTSLLLLALIIVGTLAVRSARAPSVPTLVLRQFDLPDNSDILISIVGRTAGLVGWLLTVTQIEPETSFKVTKSHVDWQSTGLRGTQRQFVPIGKVSGTNCGYFRRIRLLVLAIISSALCLLALSSGGGRPPSELSDLVRADLLLLLLSAGFSVAYFFSKRVVMSVSAAGGERVSIAFKRSAIENVAVDFERANIAIERLNRELVCFQAQSSAPAAPQANLDNQT